MKRNVILGMLLVLAILISGCTQAPATTDKKDAETTDVVTTASLVNTEDAFIKAISKDGTWIIATLGDLKIDSDLVLDGTFVNGKKDDSKFEPYTQVFGDKHGFLNNLSVLDLLFNEGRFALVYLKNQKI